MEKILKRILLFIPILIIASFTFPLLVHAEERITCTGKNLLSYENTSTTISGVSIIRNIDGSITLNGTSTANITYRLWNGNKTGILQANKSYVLSSQVNMPNKTTLRLQDSSSSNVFVDLSSQATIKNYIVFNSSRLPSLSVNCFLFIYSGYTFNNYTIYPMLEQGTSMTSYEPYNCTIPQENSDKIFLPNYKEGQCVEIKDKDTLRVFENENSTGYIDYYINSHYISKEGQIEVNYIKNCSSREFTSIGYYRNDFPEILFMIGSFCLFSIGFVFILFKRFRKR